MRFVSCLLLISITISGCVSVNRDPDILLQDPYTKVNYIAEVTKQHKTVEVIQVQTRGLQANILNTIPALYKKVLEYSENQAVEISNLSISSFTKRENFDVPYQDCVYVPQTMSVPKTSCYQGSCQTTYSTQTKYIHQCTTRYRTVMRNVLYQIASADVLTKK